MAETNLAVGKGEAQPVARGHLPAIWFFFWGEFAERSSYYGMRAILPLYLANVLEYSDADATARYSLFKMTAYFLPLLGGIIADRLLGRYWTIVGFSIPYVIGHFVLGIEQKFWCMIALFALLAPGTGVIKPNISSLLGETYDQKRPGQDSLRISAFQFFYFAVNVGALVSMFAMPILRDKYGYATAFQFPAWLMVAALAIFAAGKPFYAKESVRAVKTPAERQEQNATLVLFFAIVCALVGPLLVKPNVAPGMYPIYQSGLAIAGVSFTVLAWRMFSDEVRKTLSRLFGVFAMIALWWMAYEHNDSIWVFFARDYMHHNHTTFTLPTWLPGWLGGGADYKPGADGYQWINSLFVLIFIPVFTIGFRLVDPSMKVFTSVRRILIGFGITAVSVGTMALAAHLTNGGTVQVSSLWLVGAYILLTAGEVLVYGTMLDLSYAAAPKSMKGFITACFLLTNTVGNLINSQFAVQYGGSLKDPIDKRGPIPPLEFFGLTAGIILVVAIAFYFIGKKFERGNAPTA